jgi:beta-aspartyl-peptidase (threonine type)
VRKLFLFLLPALLSVCAAAQENGPFKQAEKEIAATLNAQVEAWNRGDLEGFMRGYWNSPELTFFSRGSATKGWQPTLDRYRKRYQSAGSEMGKLAFDDLQITLFDADAAFVRGRWRLTISNGMQPGGLFTLILRRKPEGWRIIHDHTSAECSQ